MQAKPNAIVADITMVTINSPHNRCSSISIAQGSLVVERLAYASYTKVAKQKITADLIRLSNVCAIEQSKRLAVVERDSSSTVRVLRRLLVKVWDRNVQDQYKAALCKESDLPGDGGLMTSSALRGGRHARRPVIARHNQSIMTAPNTASMK